MEPMSQRMPHFSENRGTYPIFGIFATYETFAITWQFYHFQWAGGKNEKLYLSNDIPSKFQNIHN